MLSYILGGGGMNFIIRPATLNDAKCCADIHTASWRFAYSGIVPKEIMDAYSVRWPTIWNKMFASNVDSHYVMVLNDIIVGFLTINVSRDNDLKASCYEIIGLYLHPNFISRGFGKQTMEWIKREIKSRGYDKISLWVLEENIRARRFYEKSGFVFDGETKSSGISSLQEVRYVYRLNE